MPFALILTNAETAMNKKVPIIACNKKKEPKDPDNYVRELNNEMGNNATEVPDLANESEISPD